MLEIEKQPLRVAKFRTDGEPVLESTAAVEYLKQKGIEHEKSPRHRKEHNGVVERGVRSVGESARAMMIEGSAPEEDMEWAPPLGRLR